MSTIIWTKLKNNCCNPIKTMIQSIIMKKPNIKQEIKKALKIFGSYEGIAAKMQCSSAYIRMLEQEKKQASVHFIAHLRQILRESY